MLPLLPSKDNRLIALIVPAITCCFFQPEMGCEGQSMMDVFSFNQSAHSRAQKETGLEKEDQDDAPAQKRGANGCNGYVALEEGNNEQVTLRGQERDGKMNAARLDQP